MGLKTPCVLVGHFFWPSRYPYPTREAKLKNHKLHKPWVITAKSSDTLEILLYEMIGEDWLGEGTSAKSFAEDLKAAGKVSKIHLRVNSPGGNVFDGLAIFNSLLTHGAKVTAQVDGIAASIASVIVMAASEISMSANGMVMVHNPSTMIAGDAPRMRKMAETLDKVKSSMITAYRRHSPKSAAEIGAMLDAETWMTAQETVDNGFAERVMTPEGEEAGVAANFDLSHFRKVPRKIAAMFGKKEVGAAADVCACPCTACMKDDCANCDDPECDDPNCDDCPMQEKVSAQRRAVLRHRGRELAVWAREPLTDAQRRALMRQREFELKALDTRVRAATVREIKAALASLNRIIESEESRRPKTDAQRIAVMNKYAVELGRKPFLSARFKYPGMS